MEGYQYGDDQDDDGVPDVQSYHNLTLNKKGRFQLNISQSLGDYGSVYVSGSQQSYWGTSESNVWYQLGYAGGVKGVSYALSGRGTRPSALMEPTVSPLSTSPYRSACSPVTATVAIARSTEPMPRPLPAETATVIPAGRPE